MKSVSLRVLSGVVTGQTGSRVIPDRLRQLSEEEGTKLSAKGPILSKAKYELVCKVSGQSMAVVGANP